VKNGTANTGEPERAYLDIETSFDRRLTIVGVHRPGRDILQLVGRQITPDALLLFLDGVSIIHTYNGDSFDLPRIRDCLGVDLKTMFTSEDLMHDCHRMRLYGGLKKVEVQLGISRKTAGLDGMDAMRLWERYVETDDTAALDTLLLYNREDVENLVTLRDRLSALGRC